MKSKFYQFITNRKETLIKKAMKCKDLEEDNKKLRKLLKYSFTLTNILELN